jgi:hypothetical protein
MSDDRDGAGPRRLPDPAVLDVDRGGRLLARLEHRREHDLDDVDVAALVMALRSHADALESIHLDEPPADVLERAGVSVALDDDDPTNVE